MYYLARELTMILITIRFTALENLRYGEDINRALENIIENIKTSAQQSLGRYEVKQYKPCYDEECLTYYIKGSWLKCSGYRIQTKTR
jgi:hypothetical protein